MHMDKQYKPQIYILLALLGFSFLAGCSSTKEMKKSISVEPAQQILESDSSGAIEMNVIFNIPKRYITSRSRLFVTPQLIINDSLCSEFAPMVIDAPIYSKKMKRRSTLDEYQDPYGNYIQKVDDPLSSFELKYHTRFNIPEDTHAGLIRAIVSKDGCGECSGLDTLHIADISNPVSLIDIRKSLDLNWIEPEFVIRPKILEGKGEALLQFIINRHDINISLGDNRTELERMVNTLEPILKDSMTTINNISIYGMASADGPYGFNTVLARNRALSAKKWLINRLDISPKVQNIIQTGSRPEGWWPVYQAMVADGHKDSISVKQILTAYDGSNDDVQEQFIRRLSCWPDIRKRYLPKHRKVEYLYSYTIRNFTTDEELLSMYKLRPDAFNEDELLRVAVLAENDSVRMDIYKTLMHYFPQSKVAANNLAILYLRTGQNEKARQTLETQKEYSQEMLSTMAASYAYEKDFERAIELLTEVQLPEARYNLGLLKARQRKLYEAYALLKDYRDINSAIVALSINHNQEAMGIMSELQDHTPLAEYVRAIVAARLNDETAFRKHIENACKDKSLCTRMIHEPDFKKFLNSPENDNN